jgi:hypothetical protein
LKLEKGIFDELVVFWDTNKNDRLVGTALGGLILN